MIPCDSRVGRLDAEAFMSAFDLTGRRAVVTGGSRGIGRGLAIGLAAAIGPLVTIVGKVTLALGALKLHAASAAGALKAGEGLAGAMTAFMGPAGLAVLAITAVVAIIGGMEIAGKEAETENVVLQRCMKLIKEEEEK